MRVLFSSNALPGNRIKCWTAPFKLWRNIMQSSNKACWINSPFSGSALSSSVTLTDWFPERPKTGFCKLSSWSSSSSTSSTGGSAALEDTCESETDTGFVATGAFWLVLRTFKAADGGVNVAVLGISCLGVGVTVGRSTGVETWNKISGKVTATGHLVTL